MKRKAIGAGIDITQADDSYVSVSGVSKFIRVRVKEITIGENVYKGVVMREILQNALGLGFMRRHHIILDFIEQKLHFKRGLGSMQMIVMIRVAHQRKFIPKTGPDKVTS